MNYSTCTNVPHRLPIFSLFFCSDSTALYLYVALKKVVKMCVRFLCIPLSSVYCCLSNSRWELLSRQQQQRHQRLDTLIEIHAFLERRQTHFLQKMSDSPNPPKEEEEEALEQRGASHRGTSARGLAAPTEEVVMTGSL